MAIEIRLESSWDTNDGEGRTIEVSVRWRSLPFEDPMEDSTWFAGGDLDRLKQHMGRLIDEKAESFAGRQARECTCCHRVVKTGSFSPGFLCEGCVDR